VFKQLLQDDDTIRAFVFDPLNAVVLDSWIKMELMLAQDPLKISFTNEMVYGPLRDRLLHIQNVGGDIAHAVIKGRLIYGRMVASMGIPEKSKELLAVIEESNISCCDMTMEERYAGRFVDDHVLWCMAQFATTTKQ
jgi:hypothetical protein